MQVGALVAPIGSFDSELMACNFAVKLALEVWAKLLTMVFNNDA